MDHFQTEVLNTLRELVASTKELTTIAREHLKFLRKKAEVDTYSEYQKNEFWRENNSRHQEAKDRSESSLNNHSG